VPIYEYHCEDCRRRVSILDRSISNPGTPTCPRCGGHRLERLMSRFARVRSEESRLDALADPGSFGDLDENDPASVARWADQMVEEAMQEEASGKAPGEDGEMGGGASPMGGGGGADEL
jgi:putative FmdB family regulatory protein